jgi:hypothetical protein
MVSSCAKKKITAIRTMPHMTLSLFFKYLPNRLWNNGSLHVGSFFLDVWMAGTFPYSHLSLNITSSERLLLNSILFHPAHVLHLIASSNVRFITSYCRQPYLSLPTTVFAWLFTFFKYRQIKWINHQIHFLLCFPRTNSKLYDYNIHIVWMWLNGGMYRYI